MSLNVLNELLFVFDDTKEDELGHNCDIAVITGGASGIGKGIAHKCASLRFSTIIIIDINEKKLLSTKKDINSLFPNTKIITFTKDITKRQNLEDIVHTLDNMYNINSITHLFNNAGILDALASLTDNSTENMDRLHRTMNINFWSHIYMTQMFLPLLQNNKTSKGYIINTASLAAIIQGWRMYGITKHAIASYSEALYRELKQKGIDNINVLCVCPGFVNTSLVTNTANMISNISDDHKDGNNDIKNNKINSMDKLVQTGIPVENVTDKIFDGIKNGLFYVTTHPKETYDGATVRYHAFLNGKFDQPQLTDKLQETANMKKAYNEV